MGVPPHVHGLLLTPQELSIGVPPQLPRYQVKGEGHQLQTHTRLFLGMCVVVYTLCTRSVPGQRGRAPAADTHADLSWNVCCCVHALYMFCTRSKGKGTSCRHTHACFLECMSLCTCSVPGQRGRAPAADATCTCLGMYAVVYTISTKSKGKGTNCRHTHLCT